MNNLQRGLILLVFTALILFSTGCSAQQLMALGDDGSGVVDVSIQLDQSFAGYLEDLTASLGGNDNGSGSLFDHDAVRAGFAAEAGLHLLEISSPDQHTLNLRVRFDAIPALVASRSDGLARILSFDSTPGERRLTIRLDRRAIEYVLGLTGIDPYISESLLPPEGDMTAPEYLEYLVWALEEYQEERPIREVIRQSSVESHITVAGTIRLARGGRQNGATATFRTPLVELLTTGEPVEYVLAFSR